MYSIPLLSYPTLVLNKHWTPIQTMTTRKAIGLVANGAARIIDPVTYKVHDLDSWNVVSKTTERLVAGRIRSMLLSLAPPEVIVLTSYRGVGPRSVVFSRGNLFRRDRFTCQYCGAQPGTKDLSIDHLLPRSRGGTSSWENCVVACFVCNCRKADRMPGEVGMRLSKTPQKPSWKAFLGTPRHLRYESWEKFLGRAYWEVELEP